MVSPPARLRATNPHLTLAMLSLTSFAAVLNNGLVSPLLVEMSEAFSVSVAVAAQLATVYSITITLVALVVGPLLDRSTRRTILVVGVCLLAVAAAGSTVAPSFGWMMAFRILAGMGTAVLQPSIFAAVGDLFDYRQRGRAMAWVVSANQVAPVLGLPIGTLLAHQFTWRSAWAFLVILLCATAIALARYFPGSDRQPNSRDPARGYLHDYILILRDANARAVLTSVLCASTLWFGWGTFLGAFYIQTFALETGQLAPIMMLNGLGLLLGSNLGGRLGDRLGKKRMILAGAPLLSVLLVLETNVIVGVWVAAGLNLLVCATNGSRFTNTVALVSEVRPDLRGAMMSLNAATMQLGSTLGSAMGGVVVAVAGYWLLGLLLAAAGLLGAVVLAFKAQETPVRDQGAAG